MDCVCVNCGCINIYSLSSIGRIKVYLSNLVLDDLLEFIILIWSLIGEELNILFNW